MVRVGVVVRARQTTRRGRVSVGAVALAALIASTSSACSQPGLERLARRLDRSVPRAPSTALTGKIAIRFLDVHLKGADSQATPFPVASADFVVVPGARKQALVGPTGRAAMTDHRILYARRKLNGPADHRPWVRMEVERLDDVDVPRLEALLNQQDTGVLAVLSPSFAIDALRGVLTGSIKQQRTDDGGRRFDFNLSLDKAERELKRSEDERDDFDLLRKSIALTSDIFKAQATLRPDGSLSGLKLWVVEKPDKRTSVRLELALSVSPPTSKTLWPPKREHTIRVSSLAALRGSLLDQLGPKGPVTRAPISITMRGGKT